MKLILGTTCKTRHLVCKNVLRLAGELSIVLVLDDFQPLPILYNFSGIIQHTGKTE
ncbi:capsid protein [Escherichia coli]|uniref:capsid protein n=1 Tax=Escherichia coli TaxID=562 RepID=UPI000906F0E6